MGIKIFKKMETVFGTNVSNRPNIQGIPEIFFEGESDLFSLFLTDLEPNNINACLIAPNGEFLEVSAHSTYYIILHTVQNIATSIILLHNSTRFRKRQTSGLLNDF